VLPIRIASIALVCTIIAAMVGCASNPHSKVDYGAARNVAAVENDTGKTSIFSNCAPDMVLIPGGPMMYGPTDEKNAEHAAKDEAQRINMRAFCIDKFEWPNTAGEAPTRLVTWMEASALCSKKDKRLCTEFEFEKACRGPGGTLYTYGDGYSQKACSNATDEYGLGQNTNCVSGFGVYDMSGGVFEWTSSSPPTGAGPDTSGLRIVRGGLSKESPDRSSRCTYRLRFEKGVSAHEIGFRCCGALTKAEVK
jgi:formylglycine-generating enzyme required for sulfatase activity